MNRNEFVYGKDSVRECGCPAVEAGFAPAEMKGAISVYDEQFRRFSKSDWGVVSEEEAKEAWLKVIERLDESEPGYEKAVSVAVELGWREPADE